MERYRSTNLALVIREQGRFQKWLAQQLGVSESFVSKVVLGHRTLGRVQAERVAQILGVPFFVLFELHEGNGNGAQVQSNAAD